jgi:hypothetical protein
MSHQILVMCEADHRRIPAAGYPGKHPAARHEADTRQRPGKVTTGEIINEQDSTSGAGVPS